MKLINAKSFVEFLTNLEEKGAEEISCSDLRKFIYEQRTAYDVEKVARRIKNIPHGSIFNVKLEHEILDIVYSGGVNISD